MKSKLPVLFLKGSVRILTEISLNLRLFRKCCYISSIAFPFRNMVCLYIKSGYALCPPGNLYSFLNISCPFVFGSQYFLLRLFFNQAYLLTVLQKFLKIFALLIVSLSVFIVAMEILFSFIPFLLFCIFFFHFSDIEKEREMYMPTLRCRT